MFTGLIQEVGIVESLNKNSEGLDLTVSSGIIFRELNIGSSVSINGVCSTVVKMEGNKFRVEYSNHTLSLTNISTLKKGSKVNLELPLKLSDRLDGHLVTGHVDCTVVLKEMKKDGFSTQYIFSLPNEYRNQIIRKGSITLNGISLTVSNCREDIFSVEIIPHTLAKTNLGQAKVGSLINLETDLTGKYIEKIMLSNDNRNNNQNKIDINFLSEKGFL